jgi:alpha-methylacyl-CoA racemase
MPVPMLVADERGHSIHDSAPFYETYACADGGFITVGAIEPQFHALLLDRLGLADAAAFQGPQWDRAAWPARRSHLQALFASRPRAHWQQLLEGSDACFGAVLSPVEAASHPHLQARGVYLQPEGGALQASPAPRFDGQAYAPGPANAAGSDTASVREKVSAGRAQEVWRSAR